MPDAAETITEVPGGKRRGYILDADAIAAIFARPQFSAAERDQYFTMSHAEEQYYADNRDDHTKLGFLLQLGYFHAKQRFFSFTFADVLPDAWYLCQRYQLQNVNPVTQVPLHSDTITRQRDAICAVSGYRRTTAVERAMIQTRAGDLARISSDPLYVFREVMQYLSDERIIGPRYTVMQNLVSTALTAEHDRLTALLKTHLTPDEREQLTALLHTNTGRRPITWLKRDPKDFSKTAMQDELARGQILQPLAACAARILPTFAISQAAIAHYAWLVTYYSSGRLEGLDDDVQLLYLLCFVHRRYHRLNDHLITCLLQLVKQYHTEAITAMQEQTSALQSALTKDFPKVGKVLKLLLPPTYPPETPLSIVHHAAFAHLSPERLAELADYLLARGTLDASAFYWMKIDTLMARAKPRLRPLLMALDMAATHPNSPLLEAVRALQTHFTAGRPLTRVMTTDLPSGFMNDHDQRAITVDETQEFIRDRYEFLLYRSLRKAIEAGELVCAASIQFRSFEDDLIPDAEWADKTAVLERIAEPRLLEPIDAQLATLKQELEARIRAVNARIKAGKNPHVTIKSGKKRTTWSVRYPRPRDPINHAVFDTVPQVSITSVLQFVEERCPFLQAFTHVSGRYQKPPTDDHIIRACLVAWGTNMGVGRMGTISDIPTHVLTQASENYLRLETLQHASDHICNAMAAMPRFRRFDLGDHVHSSSDGQKFETQRVTFGARYGPKYFGRSKKGRVAYSLVASHLPIAGRMIGAHEHESHYVFDILKQNATDVRPRVHSTDTHGTNHVNSALLYLFGYLFAPRYKNLPRKVATSLYGFQHPRQYGDVLLTPVRKINTALIRAEWDNLLRIFASLALKTTSQHIIVRKLSSYARRNSTAHALWELDRIITSLYLLEYVDSAPLRQHVQRALNRGEQYHHLRRAVSYANIGKLRFTTETDQELWNECSRLLANCILFYNMTVLDRLLAQKEADGDTVSAAAIAEIAPIAWQHINFYGRYEFVTIPERIDLEALVATLAQRQYRPENAENKER
ncbi:Tn3 family transposase [Herpetosiphon gulosus]|uniref:Tn3 family transposase ISPsy42 n=1 Tax=Herpetosiphon gulosus TaxID=1973496 RepID=A0ABP9X8A1_9CHLR